MKYKIFIFILVFSLLVNFVYTQSSSDPNLVLHINFDDETSTQFLDKSGNNNHGVKNGGVVAVSDGVKGKAGSFDGQDDYVNISNNIGINGGSVTVAAWVFHDSLPAKIQRYVTVESEVAVIRHDGENSAKQLHFYIKTGGTLRHLRVNDQLETGKWFYIVGTFDGTTQKLYKNGVLIGEQAPGGNLDTGTTAYISSPLESMHVKIDEVRIYNRALSAQEIQDLYNSEKPQSTQPTQTPTSTTITEFNVFFNNDTCFIINDDNDKNFIKGGQIGESYWVNTDASSFNSINDCYNTEGVDRNGDSKTMCCPLGYICDNSSSPAKCAFTPTKERAQDFKTEAECINANDLIAIKELDSIIDKSKFAQGCEFTEPYGDFCYQYISCKLEWDSKKSKCQAVARHKVAHVTQGKIENWDFDKLPSNIKAICEANKEPLSGKCVFDFTYAGSCLEGDEFVTRSWTAFFETNAASASTPDYCVDGSDTIACEKVVRLPFFTLLNLIITILLIIVIYFILVKKQNK